ncbi:MAG: polysaccharide deacetylase family protein [Bacteroidota bacterium]
MLYLLCDFQSTRLDYILNIVFDRILQTEYTLLSWEAYQQGIAIKDDTPHVVMYYGEKPGAGQFFIPDSGLLRENRIREEAPVLLEQAGRLPQLFFQEELQLKPTEGVTHDLLASCFFLITQYERYQHPTTGTHGRYDEVAYDSYTRKWHHHPLVQLLAEELWQQLLQLEPKLSRIHRRTSLHLTFDVDHPWKYWFRGFFVNAGGLLKHTFQLRFQVVGEMLKALFSGSDPYNTYPLIHRHFPPEHTAFFFLLDRTTPQDGWHTYKNRPYRKLVKGLKEKGYGIGLHPSYATYLNPERIKFERERLNRLVLEDSEHSRQHFLRYRLPETFRFLLEAGIRHDYTLAMYTDRGFPTGMALSYPWFDLGKNEATELMLHPTTVMDRSLKDYQGLGVDEAMTQCRELWKEVDTVNGCFRILLHNNTLSDEGEWEGWRMPILNLVEELTSSL